MRSPLAGRSRAATTVVALLALLVVAALVATATVVSSREPVVHTEDLAVDGVAEPGVGGAATPVRLDVRLYRPEEATSQSPAPAVLLAHGYGGTRESLDGEARELARRGYVVLTWTARGFGRSGGLVHLNAPDYEVADARGLVDLLAQRPEVLVDGPGDPRVGVAGASYGGALALSLAGTDPRIDAIVPQITWNDLRRVLFPQSILPAAVADGTAPRSPAQPVAVAPVEGGVFKKAWAAVFFGPQSPGQPSFEEQSDAAAPDASQDAPAPSRAGDDPVTACGRVAVDLCRQYQAVAVTGRPDAAMLDLLAASSPALVVPRITAPTLLIQGQMDSLFPLSEADATAAALAQVGTEVSVVWSVSGHDGGRDESDRWRALTIDWFDTHLRARPEGDAATTTTRFQVTVPGSAVSTQDSDPAATIRGSAVVPGLDPADDLAVQEVSVAGQEQAIVRPAGGWPAAITALPGLGGRTALAASPGSAAMPSGQVAVFDSEPLAQSLSIVGSSSVRVQVVPAAPGPGSETASASGSASGTATLFVSLQTVAPDGQAVLPAGLVSPVRLTGVSAAGSTVDVVLPAVVRDVPAGHRLRVVVAASDQAYATPAEPASYRVALAGGAGSGEVKVPVPALQTLQAGGVVRYLSWAVGLLIGGVLLALGLWGWSRRDARPPPGAQAAPVGPDLPLAVDGVAKVYRNGFRAVREVSMRVEPGMVLGLLGPNGAGKTTLLRMVLGLILPTAGRITVFGQEVRPGAPVLSRVGAFVEGPGFLPHCSGRENLRLFWAATGRPQGEAFVDVALEVAGLGEDVNRTVRTYSQGMRQRLAIAQAMLGLPDLLVLDEPTNGLDPPQIREMREVLARYAATGRTVVVSSHLLSEVEQTCSHVVVMHHGDVVATGEVADLVGAATGLVVDVDDPDRAAEVVATVPGAQAIEVMDGGLTLELVGTPRSVLVRALVESGLDVERVAPRRGLEQAFLTLVGEGADA